mmetsp:Transcript_10437/g.28861  ORF Transcript_10437/g.28861 Transcript_10437/m.28861 type:complete len:126 (+) Transcript_10437:586-963(+)
MALISPPSKGNDDEACPCILNNEGEEEIGVTSQRHNKASSHPAVVAVILLATLFISVAAFVETTSHTSDDIAATAGTTPRALALSASPIYDNDDHDTMMSTGGDMMDRMKTMMGFESRRTQMGRD